MRNGFNSDNEFCFGRHDDIGAAAAEDDNDFLGECFINTGDLDALLDSRSPKRIIIGRTGAGKSALLTHIDSACENVIKLSPHSLSLNYIANNNVIEFFEEAGVNLSVFYGLLWRHVLVVELLKKKFNITSENSQKDYTSHIRRILSKKDKFKEMAVDYLEQWGNRFWLTTEERMHELTQKIEKSLSSSVGGNLSGFDLSANGAHKLSEEQRRQIIQIGKRVVSEIQIRELENIITLLAEEVFTDKQQKYYIIIDGLDEEWVDERIKYKLIKSLIDAIRRFKIINNVKILVAMRQDLLDKVVHTSRELGFQEEKYESLYLRLGWEKNDLKDMVNKRIGFLIRRKYTKKSVGWSDIFPANIDQTPTLDYLVERTFNRPRDMIAFMNECIVSASGEATISAHNIKLAEEQYSYKRLQSLATEWQIIYPELFEVAQMFFGMPHRFKLSTANEKWFEEKYLEILDSLSGKELCPIVNLLNGMYSTTGNFSSARNTFFRGFYNTGLIGIKTGTNSAIHWSHKTSRSISPGQLKPSSSIYIHPMFYKALGINLSN